MMHEYKATLQYWVDGNTCDLDIDLGFGIVIKDQRVKLEGIIAPDLRTKDEKEKSAANLAVNFCKSRIKEGSECLVKTYKEGTGKNGKIVAEVYYLAKKTTQKPMMTGKV